MSLFYHGKLLTTPMGPAGPDGNPIGTILSFLGLTPPKDYLVCDGSVLNIGDYQDLATFFETQFGTKNHFGGDGETTFALPDMRNLFLRGWHGEAEEQLSGDIGEKQEATEIPSVFSTYTEEPRATISIIRDGTAPVLPLYTDKLIPGTNLYESFTDIDIGEDHRTGKSYTSRPVNTAVLFCIKAVESIGYDTNDYSLEEKRIGTWIDGKPIYRKVISGITANGANVSVKELNIATLCAMQFVCQDASDSGGDIIKITAPYESPNDNFKVYISVSKLSMIATGTLLNQPYIGILEYTKTTD